MLLSLSSVISISYRFLYQQHPVCFILLSTYDTKNILYRYLGDKKLIKLDMSKSVVFLSAGLTYIGR